MPGAGIVILHPAPRDPGAFGAYREEHLPRVTSASFAGMTKLVATRVVGAAGGGTPPFARMAELHVPSLEALQAAAGSESAQRAASRIRPPRSPVGWCRGAEAWWSRDPPGASSGCRAPSSSLATR